jgi:Bacterial dnaA protein helix-turn-helix
MNNQEEIYEQVLDCVVQSFNETFPDYSAHHSSRVKRSPSTFITKEDILSVNRTQYYVKPRAAAVYMVRIFTNIGTKELGRRFSGRTHSSMIHLGNKTHEALYMTNDLYRYQFNYALELFINKNTTPTAIPFDIRAKMEEIFEIKSRVNKLISLTLNELKEHNEKESKTKTY